MAETKSEMPNDEESRLDAALAWLKTMPRMGAPRGTTQTTGEEKKPNLGSE